MEFHQLTEGGIISIMISKIQQNDDGDRMRKKTVPERAGLLGPLTDLRIDAPRSG